MLNYLPTSHPALPRAQTRSQTLFLGPLRDPHSSSILIQYPPRATYSFAPVGHDNTTRDDGRIGPVLASLSRVISSLSCGTLESASVDFRIYAIWFKFIFHFFQASFRQYPRCSLAPSPTPTERAHQNDESTQPRS
ncbi:hypothetical protein BJ165DRAFT_1597561, partial [Panaeolus papilionaceus]